MSRKHHCKHPDRNRSNYPARLARRHVSNAQVHMASLSSLRKRQERRISETGFPWPTGAEAEDELAA